MTEMAIEPDTIYERRDSNATWDRVEVVGHDERNWVCYRGVFGSGSTHGTVSASERSVFARLYREPRVEVCRTDVAVMADGYAYLNVYVKHEGVTTCEISGPIPDGWVARHTMVQYSDGTAEVRTHGE